MIGAREGRMQLEKPRGMTVLGFFYLLITFCPKAPKDTGLPFPGKEESHRQEWEGIFLSRQAEVLSPPP